MRERASVTCIAYFVTFWKESEVFEVTQWEATLFVARSGIFWEWSLIQVAETLVRDNRSACLFVWLSLLTIHIRSSCHQHRHYFSLVHPRWIHSSNIVAYVSYSDLLFSLFFPTVDSILFWTFTFFNVLDHRTHTIRIVTSKRRKRECDIITLFGRQISFCLCRSLRARKCGS